MEHLLYNPDARTFRAEIRSAAKNGLEITDWLEYDDVYGPCPPVAPRVPWLGHQHRSLPRFSSSDDDFTMLDALDQYGRDWDLDKMFNHRDLRAAHSSLQDQHLSEREVVRHVAAFIQSFSYLGLLEAICGRSITPSFLVRADADGLEWIYSRNLPLLLELWTKDISQLNMSSRTRMLTQARQCAISVSTMLQHDLEEFSKDDVSRSFLLLKQEIYSVEPALTSLVEALTRFVEFHLRSEIKFSRTVTSLSSRAYLERLVKKGWCPYVLATAEMSISASFLRYIDAAELVATSKGHHRCTPSRCERNFVVRETYTQGHVPAKCRCKFLRPNLATALEILDAGYYPVVLFDPSAEVIDLGGVHPSDEHADYVAFSHVWADGLGSCTEVGLPLCQLRRLHRMARARLASRSAFWIDSLCIPKQEPHRGAAIQLMKATYRNATGVIVLDHSLSELSVKTSILQVGWTVFASGWFGRLWTYQEGYLATWVDLQVQDGFIDFSTIIRQLYDYWHDMKGSKFPGIFLRDLVAMLQKARPLAASPVERSMKKRTIDLFNALTRRDTSRPDDQILVMGLMLDIDIQELLELEGEAKWKAFYLSLKHIPWTIVFDRRAKMELQGFNWAPKTWISTGQDEFLHYDENMADITLDGLQIEVVALCLDRSVFNTFSILYLRINSLLYRLVQSHEKSPSTLQMFNVVIVRHFANETPEMHLRQHRSLYARVGLGLMDDTTGSRLRYDFTGDPSIILPAEYDESELSTIEIVNGRWKSHKFCFT